MDNAWSEAEGIAVTTNKSRKRRIPYNARQCQRIYNWKLVDWLLSLVEIESPILREELNAKWEESTFQV